MRYWTSDLHLGHPNIIRYCQRPYTNVEQMNLDIIARINEHAGPHDELWILGDVCLGDLDTTLGLLSQLTAGTLVLVAGNHDRIHPSNSNANRARYAPRYEAAFDHVITGNTTVRLPGHDQNVCVSHFPYQLTTTEHRGRNTKDRYAPYRPTDTGNWLLCGHVHTAWATLDRQINVGIDAWHHPLSDRDISELVGTGPQHRPAEPWPTQDGSATAGVHTQEHHP